MRNLVDQLPHGFEPQHLADPCGVFFQLGPHLRARLAPPEHTPDFLAQLAQFIDDGLGPVHGRQLGVVVWFFIRRSLFGWGRCHRLGWRFALAFERADFFFNVVVVGRGQPVPGLGLRITLQEITEQRFFNALIGQIGVVRWPIRLIGELIALRYRPLRAG